MDVKVQLRRPSDGATSEPRDFKYTPLDSGRPFWSLKKLKANYGIFSSILAANTALMTAPRPMVPNGTSSPTDENEASTSAHVSEPIVQEAPLHDVKPAELAPQPSSDEHEYEFTEVGQWENKNPPKTDYTDDLLSQGETCKSLNDLLSQVAELEEIYPEPQPDAELQECLKQSASAVADNIPMDVDDVYESGHYTSLQLAMKNPILIDIDFEDTPAAPSPQPPAIPPHSIEIPLPEPQPPVILPTIQPDSNKRESTCTDKLPPLPPKRFRKNTKDDGVEERNSINSEEPSPQLPPRAFPPVIENIEPKQKSSKPNFFQKLFSRKGKSKKEGALPKSGSVPCNLSEVAPNEDLLSSVPPSPTVDLTEAEHYALYTDVAPRATASEFDEMSFYYSPVEGQMEKPLPPEPVNEKQEKRNSVSKLSDSIRDIFS